jgi:flagellar hook assembly protein FlgD
LLLDNESVPEIYSLGHAYPNPFNPVVTIPFTIEKPRDVSIHIFDISGRRVNTILQNQFLPPGLYHKNWAGSNDQGRNVSTGTYIIQITSGTELLHQKITFIK